MAIGKLEPLYRYLKTIKGEPVSSMLRDINALAKSEHVTSRGNGEVQILDTPTTDAEIRATLNAIVGSPIAYHMSVQAVADRMFFGLSRIADETSKTILALSVGPDNVPKIEFIEPDAIFAESLHLKELWNSVMITSLEDDGSTNTGFLRFNARIAVNADSALMAVEIDFKSSHTGPFWFSVGEAYSSRRTCHFGTPAQATFNQLWSH